MNNMGSKTLTAHWAGLVPAGLLLLCSCASQSSLSSDERARRDVVHMEAMRIQREADPLTGLDTYDAGDLLEKGNELFDKSDFDKAIKVYEHLVASFADSSLVPTALYNAGLAFERLAEYAEALSRFRRIIADHPTSPNTKDAYYRSSLNLAKLERWSEVADNYWTIRQLEGLSSMDEIEARVGMAIAMFMMEDYATAEREFASALRFYEEKQSTEYLPATYWMAQSRFYLGEIYARYFEQVKLESGEVDHDKWISEVATLLETKCEHLIRAQNHLIRAIRAGHTGWATAAGFRIGSLYETLYDDMMTVPTPPDLPEGAKEIYTQELRGKLAVLVSKAMMVYERSLEMAERVGEKNEWVERTTKALERMKSLALENLEG